MTIFVGSTNPVKLNAVKLAVAEKYKKAEVVGFETKSGVSDQPMTDEETKTGAINRAKSALEQGKVAQPGLKGEVLGIGLEGGVFIDEHNQMWSTVWVAVADTQGEVYLANGARVKVPSVIADLVHRGEEMGPVLQSLTGITDVRKKQGMFGIITKDFVSRTEEYGAIAKCAIGLWYGRDWAKPLSSR